MAKKDFLRKIAEKLSTCCKRHKAPEGEEPEPEAPRPAEPLQEAAPPQARAAAEETAELLEAVRRQQDRIDALTERLGELAGAWEKLLEAVRSQGDLGEQVAAALGPLGGHGEELVRTLDDLAGEVKKQTDVLGSIQAGLAQQPAGTELLTAIGNVERQVATAAEALQQVRGAEDDRGLLEALARCDRKFTVLMIAGVGLLGLLTAAVVVFGLLGL